MYGSGTDSVGKARSLVIAAAISGVFVLIAYFVPNIERPPIIAAAGGSVVVAWGWNIYLNPMLGM